MKSTNAVIEIKDQVLWKKWWDNSLVIKNATLHGPVSVGGFATEKTINKDKLIGAQLRYVPEGLLIALKDVRCLIPAPNVACAILENL